MGIMPILWFEKRPHSVFTGTKREDATLPIWSTAMLNEAAIHIFNRGNDIAINLSRSGDVIPQFILWKINVPRE